MTNYLIIYRRIIQSYNSNNMPVCSLPTPLLSTEIAHVGNLRLTIRRENREWWDTKFPVSHTPSGRHYLSFYRYPANIVMYFDQISIRMLTFEMPLHVFVCVLNEAKNMLKNRRNGTVSGEVGNTWLDTGHNVILGF